MDLELVSVVVPIYNTEAYLQECIDSLVGQTYQNTEIILVNDGSTDGSLAICNDNAERYRNIRVINQENKGVSAARNRGIMESKGEYITFVDSDDVLRLDALEIMHERIVRLDADIVSAAMVNNEYSEEEKQCKTTVRCGLQTVVQALENVSISACAKLYKKGSIQGIFYKEDKKINEDGYFIFECYMRQPKVVEINEGLYFYRKRLGSASRSVFSEKYLDMFFFLEQKKKYIENNYPELQKKMVELEVRTNLNMLQLLCQTKEKKYKLLEKQCCSFVRIQRNIDKGLFCRYERRVHAAVCLRVYPLYKFMIRVLKR